MGGTISGLFAFLQVRLDLIVSGVERLDRRWVLGASSAKRLDAHPFVLLEGKSKFSPDYLLVVAVDLGKHIVDRFVGGMGPKP